jgi:hypothetical protein
MAIRFLNLGTRRRGGMEVTAQIVGPYITDRCSSSLGFKTRCDRHTLSVYRPQVFSFTPWLLFPKEGTVVAIG